MIASAQYIDKDKKFIRVEYDNGIVATVPNVPQNLGFKNLKLWVDANTDNVIQDFVSIIPKSAVDDEKSRRRATFVYGGKEYQCSESEVPNLSTMGALAKFALLTGAQPGNLRWADADNDFGWIALDNTITLMDAPTMSDFADKAMIWVSRHIFTARALKDIYPNIPAEFTMDAYWPVPEPLS
jgi:hypothetical protein